MKRLWSYMLFGTLVVVSGSLIAVGQQSPPAAESPTPEVSVVLGMTDDGKIAGEKSVAVARRIVDGTKIVTILRGPGDPVEGYVVAEDDVMNVTAITISNGNFSTGVFKRGGLTIQVGAHVHLMLWDGYGMVHQTFPTPMPLRAGDQLQIAAEDGNAGSLTLITLIGRDPLGGDKLTIH